MENPINLLILVVVASGLIYFGTHWLLPRKLIAVVWQKNRAVNEAVFESSLFYAYTECKKYLAIEGGEYIVIRDRISGRTVLKIYGPK